MKFKQKRLNILILITLLIVASSLLGAYYTAKPEAAIVSGSSKPNLPPVERKADTLLMIQVTKNANCAQQVVQLTEAELLALPQQQFTTHHSWATEAEAFTGPSLEDVLGLACKHPTKINLEALNNYAIDVDFASAKTLKPIVAHSVNGKRLSIREKGPLWVMSPIDELNIPPKSLDPLLIWQLNNIVILSTDEVF